MAGGRVHLIEYRPAIQARIIGASAPCEVKHVLVGDLWLLAGQSNMDGYDMNKNPYCNLVDEQDMAACVMGPIAIGGAGK